MKRLLGEIGNNTIIEEALGLQITEVNEGIVRANSLLILEHIYGLLHGGASVVLVEHWVRWITHVG